MNVHNLSRILLAVFVGFVAANKPVLVIGGTGRVGKAVTSKLLAGGFNVRLLVRDLDKATHSKELQGASFVQGDVNNMDALVTATQGVSSVIDVHGMRPLRFTKISDIFIHPKKDILHPYNVNYVGVKRILAAMEINKVNKIVRITGSLVGKSAFSPFRVLFNVLLSMTGKWHEASEIEIRRSGLDYTVLRPTGIHDDPPAATANRSLVLVHGESSEKVPVPAKISVSDLSDLILLSLKDERLSKCSAICSSRPGAGESSWVPLLSKLHKDSKPLALQPHKLAVAVYLSMLLSLLGVLGRVAAIAFAQLFTLVRPFVRKNFPRLPFAA